MVSLWLFERFVPLLVRTKVRFRNHNAKIVLSMRILMANVPYHSDYLQGATDEVFEIEVEGKELWTLE